MKVSIPEAHAVFRACGGSEDERCNAVAGKTGYTAEEIRAIAHLYAAKANTKPYKDFKDLLPARCGPYFSYSVVVPADKNRLYLELIKYYDQDEGFNMLLGSDLLTFDDVLQLELTYDIPYSNYCDLTERERTVQDLIDGRKMRIDLPTHKSREIKLNIRKPGFITTSFEAEEFANDLVFYGKTVLKSLMEDSFLQSQDIRTVRLAAQRMQNIYDMNPAALK